MNALRTQGAAAAVLTSIAQRIINVGQNLFPGPGRPSATQVDIGLAWASMPQSLTVDGKTINVALLQGSKNGAPFSKYMVSLPILSDGDHAATVKLANGVSVSVILSVHSTH